MVDMQTTHHLPDLDLLRCFQCLHDERHLTRAARRAGLSQPAMSRALGRLREVFSDPLFVRTRHGMSPTPRADQLAPGVRAVLEATVALVQPATFDPARLVRTFAIGTSDFFDVDLIPRLVGRLAEVAPKVSIATRPLTDDQGPALRDGRLDLLIGVRASVPSDAMVGQLFEDGFVCAVRRDHPTVGKRLTLDHFVALPHLMIAPGGTPGGPVDDALAARGLARTIVVRTHTFLSAPAIIARSDLVLTAPRRVLEPLARAFGLKLLAPPLPTPRFTILQAWHPRVHHDPVHGWFRRMVVDVVRRS
jgi:DNA-binding transcriptional LysR family regulator